MCDTYFDACSELHLLEDDNHWDLTLADVVLSSSRHKIRRLFAILLTISFPSEASALWDKYKDLMSEDILHRIKIADQDPNIHFSPEIYSEFLIKIEDICVFISNMLTIHLCLTTPNRPAAEIINSDVQREQKFDSTSWVNFVDNVYEQLLTAEQTIYMIKLICQLQHNKADSFFWSHQVVLTEHSLSH